jgi:alkylation response protein AidB-like acyl-CoA dehydrogenase
VLEGAVGTLVGEPNKGLQAMFVMMNAARIGVGMQSLGLTEVAYQNALAYAKDRIQMRSLSGVKAKDKPADPIIVHPDVRKMLLTAKAYAEGGRALTMFCSLLIDRELHHPDAKVRKEPRSWSRCSRPSSRPSSPTTATSPPTPACRCSAGTASSRNGAWSSSCGTTAST